MHRSRSHHRNRHRDESSSRSSRKSKSHKRDKKSKSSRRDRKSRRRHSSESSSRPSSSSSSTSSSSSASSSSSSSSASDKETKLLIRLQEKRKRQQEERRKLKELQKAQETPKEKRIRRLLKKEAKEKKRKQQMGWDNDYLHYTNVDNPFGDNDLLSTFRWDKKLEKEGLKGVSQEEVAMMNKIKMEENKRELEKVKKRRIERELEKQQREEEMSLMQRSKEAAQFQEWEQHEDMFHLEQARLRSRIRIQDGRAKPIDLLAKYISTEEEVDAVEMHEPYTYLNGLTIKDLEDLVADIKVYIELERGMNLDYWNDITVIVEDELYKLRKQDSQTEYQAAVARREGIHESVAKDVANVLKGKTAEQLVALQTQIEAKLKNKADGVDIGYWESLLSQLKAHQARARLRDRHQNNLFKKLQVLKAEQGVDENSSVPKQEISDAPSTSASSAKPERQTETRGKEDTDDSSNEEMDEAKLAEAMINECIAEYEAGGYSPKYVSPSSLEPGTIITLVTEDLQRLEFARRRVQGLGAKVENVITAEEKALHREARKGMTDDEVEFSVESILENQVYFWSDKYRPRKPRYFNRVHTGFEWNKYNQTHYDMDNPPPKIVQGYKFNIFYPDLIDKSSTPEYFLTPCPDNHDFAILRFHAGPPYEDIAFKIVNREWEYSYKRGFRCQFQNNIFQLWFHFKRYRYRR
nr:PREDICTED: cactin [Bemisia tabaci]